MPIHRRGFAKIAGILTLAAASLMMPLSPVEAQLIFLSSDGNIANPLTGSTGGVSADNQRFFQNVLGSGTSVAVRASTHTGSIEAADTDIDTFYDGLVGVTSNLFNSPITPAILNGVDLLFVVVPNADFTNEELTTLSAFVSGGGSIFFLGENNNADFTASNNAINSALTALGAGIQIVPDSFDFGFNESTVAADVFTTGVTSIRYAAPSQVSGGTQIAFGTEARPFLTYVRLNGGSTGAPEPGTWGLLLTGIGAALLARRRRSR